MVRKSGLGSTGKTPRKYFQHNYIDVVKSITPDLYSDTDYAIYGTEDDVLYSVLGKLLKTVDEIGTIVDVDNYEASDLQQRFIVRNNLTHIRPNIFENKILKALGKSFSDFESKYSFKQYIENELLPNIQLNDPSNKFIKGVETSVDPTINSKGKVKRYLMENLSWVYMLNTNGPAEGYDPSSTISKYLADLYDNKPITEKEGIFMLFEYLWYNKEVHPSYMTLIPQQFAKTNEEVKDIFFASGNQQLKGLKTLLGVWYHSADESSTTLDDYLDVYLVDRNFTPQQIAGGALTKFLQAVSFGFYDVNSTISDLEDLVDIERCPPEFLQYLATLIGWKLLTGDVDRWRAQLRKAVYLYKSKGTRRCLEDAISLVLPGMNLDITNNIHENWELYLPRMIYYLIATASPVLKDPNYAYGSLPGVAEDQISIDDQDLNYRTATDYVLRTLHELTPPSILTPEGGAIYINKVKFDLSSWDPTNVEFSGFLHRGRPNVQIPPWEDDRFYDTTLITKEQIKILNEILTASSTATITGQIIPGGGLEIPAAYVSQLSSIVLKEDVADSLYVAHWNQHWKSYNPDLIPPPNLSALQLSKDLKSLSMLDAWCSKSSFIFSNIEIPSISHEVEGVSLGLGNVMGNITSIFRSFIPFHVTFKLFAEVTLDETYEPSGSLCISVDRHLYSVSADGDTDQTVLTNHIPSGVGVSGTVISPYPSTPRTSGRRRNLKYIFNHAVFSRNGKAMPIASMFYSASAGIEPSGVAEFNFRSSEFIPLGYNFSSGLYLDPSGSLSGVYDASNDLSMSALELQYLGDIALPGTEYYIPLGTRKGIPDSSAIHNNITVSSTFPCRALVEAGCDTVVRRDSQPRISEVIMHKMISVLSATDDFGERTVHNFKFGKPIHDAFYNASGDFSAIRNFTYDDPTHDIPYSEFEVKIIFAYFNELAGTKSSRLNFNSSGTFGGSGGFRGYYIDNFGGTVYGINDTVSPYGQGVNYQVIDD